MMDVIAASIFSAMPVLAVLACLVGACGENFKRSK